MALTEKRKASLRKWYAKNREARRLKHKLWRDSNRAKLRAWRLKNKAKIFEAKRLYRIRNREKIAAKKRMDYKSDRGASAKLRAKNWKRQNPDRTRELQAIWRKKNRARYRAAKHAEYLRRKEDPFKRINMNMGRLMYMALRGKSPKAGTSWKNLVDYSVQDLHRHLESQFTDGMTWAKFIAGEIHVDHIRPISWFKFSSTSDAEFRACWSLRNLQPLWASDNLRKQGRWEGGASPGRSTQAVA